jgi:hypothetical protein
MNSKLRFAIGAIALIVAVIVGFVILRIIPTNWRSHPILDDVIVSLPAVLVGLAITAYHSFDKVYFALHRLWMRLDPRATIRFQLSVDLGLVGQVEWDVLQRLFIQHFPKYQIWEGAHGPIFALTNAAIRTRQFRRIPDEPDTWTLRLAFNEVELPFATLDRLVDPLTSFLDSVRKTVCPVDEKYVFKVKFNGINPYFGLFLQRARVPRMITFDVVFEEYVGGSREVVRILDKEVQITARSLAGWQVLGKKYALLSLSSFETQ